MFTYNPQEKIILGIKKWPRWKVYMHLILNTVLLPEWSIVVHESLVCPEQLKNHALRAGAWTLFEFEDQGKLI